MAKNWERSELILAVELYCRTPFGRIHNRNPEIIALASRLGRTPGAIGMKLANFASLDPTLDRRGFGNTSRLDAEVWEEFFADPKAFLDQVDQVSATLRAPEAPPEPDGFREGSSYEYTAQGRRNQDFFRATVLASYNNKCAITGIERPELLIASHIVPWANNEKTRLDPRNGICLNSLHDRAFDRGLITFEDDFSLVVSSKLRQDRFSLPFFEGKRLQPPERFRPEPKYLAVHREQIFERG